MPASLLWSSAQYCTSKTVYISKNWRGCSCAMIVMRVRSVQRSVPCEERGHHARRAMARWAIFNAGDERFSTGSRSARWLSALIGSSPARSSPRVLAPRVARCPPAAGSSSRPVPGRWKFLEMWNFLTKDFVVDASSWRNHEGLCGRRKLVASAKRRQEPRICEISREAS